MEKEEDFYDRGVDYALLEKAGITFVKHQPWQIGLMHPELDGKFVWYPYAGTLMYQKNMHGKPLGSEKIGDSGNFMAIFINGKPDEIITQRVIDEVLKKARE